MKKTLRLRESRKRKRSVVESPPPEKVKKTGKVRGRSKWTAMNQVTRRKRPRRGSHRPPWAGDVRGASVPTTNVYLAQEGMVSLFFSCTRIDSFARMACESCFSKKQHCRLPEKEQELTEWEAKTLGLFTETTDALKHIASLLEGPPLKRHVVPLGGSPTVVVVAPTEGQGGSVCD